MPKKGPVILVNESSDEQEIICRAFNEIGLKNRIELCRTAEQALNFLNETTEKPFLILTKVELPGISGLDFLAKVMQSDYLRVKSIPFIFFSECERKDIIQKAYDMRAQGFFVMPKEFIRIKLAMFSITDYWSRAAHPSCLVVS